MKRRLHISGILLLSVFAACIRDDTAPRLMTIKRALMAVEVISDGASDEDFIRTARFITFDNASVDPRLDVNTRIGIEEEDQDATSFRTYLEVMQNPDKMLIVIINEPESLTATLNGIARPADVENVMFDMSEPFPVIYAAPVPPGMPMSGAKRGIAVTEANATESTAKEVGIRVERSVARVELWLKKDSGLSQAWLGTADNKVSEITLANTTAYGYLAAGTEYDGTRFQTGAGAENNFGKMQTVDDPQVEHLWQYDGTADLQLSSDALLISYFYVPERTCRAADGEDKIELQLDQIHTSDGDRDAVIVLDKAVPDGGSAPTELTEIRRNNIYRIIATLEAHVQTVAFSVEVVPWVEENIGVIIDPQYYLRLTQSRITLTNEPNAAVIIARTDYDRTDRGFPMGIHMDRDEVVYYNSGGVEITDTASPMSGWLTWTGGFDGDMTREIMFELYNGLLDQSCDGCYAIVPVRAGNLSKEIRVDFSYTPPPGPQYYINMTNDSFLISNSSPQINSVSTDYPGGLTLGETRYYDQSDNPVSSSGNPYGWLSIYNITPGDPSWPMMVIYLNQSVPSSYNGCYATVEVKAGVLIRTIKVTIAN